MGVQGAQGPLYTRGVWHGRGTVCQTYSCVTGKMGCKAGVPCAGCATGGKGDR